MKDRLERELDRVRAELRGEQLAREADLRIREDQRQTIDRQAAEIRDLRLELERRSHGR